MLHEPAVELGEDLASKRKTKLGLILVSVYGLVYFTFVFIGIFYTEFLSITLFGGLSLAVVYGFGIIILAIVMGFIYSLACTRMEDQMNGGSKK
jgi:uncharacterized membrane protein (DUF485 family)